MKKFLLLIVLCLLLTSCDDPVRVEKANAMRRESEAQALATRTATQTERGFALQELSEQADIIADREAVRAATQPQRIARDQTIQRWTGGFFVAYVLVVFVAFAIAAIGSGMATSRKANLAARLVWIDKTTRTFPILLEGDRQGNRYLINFETGERAQLTDVAPVHPGQLAISGQVRNVGLLAQSTEKIAKSTKDAQPADMLPAVAQSVPILTPSAKVDVWELPPIPKHKWPRELREASNENETEGM